MESQLKKQPEVIQVSFNGVHDVIKENKEQNEMKNGKKVKTFFQQLLQKQSIVNALTLIVILLFFVFVFKLCFGKRIKDPRIIRGSGSGSSVLSSGSRKALRSSSLSSNHRNGMKVPQLRNTEFSDSSNSDEDW